MHLRPRVTRLCFPFACIPSQIHNRRRRKTRFYDRSFFFAFSNANCLCMRTLSYVCVCARVSTGSWKLLPKYSHKRYSQHGGIPNLGGKCRSDGTLAVSNYIRRGGFRGATRFYIPSIFWDVKSRRRDSEEKISHGLSENLFQKLNELLTRIIKSALNLSNYSRQQRSIINNRILGQYL